MKGISEVMGTLLGSKVEGSISTCTSPPETILQGRVPTAVCRIISSLSKSSLAHFTAHLAAFPDIGPTEPSG